MGGKSKMNELKSSSEGGMNINILTILSSFILVISCTLFSFSGLNLHESKSEKRQILDQIKNYSNKIPLVKDEIEALEERITLKEQKAQKEQQALQKEVEQKELQAALNKNAMSARRKYFLKHGMTPEQAQARASNRANLRTAREDRIKLLQQEIISLAAWDPPNDLGERTRILMISQRRKELQILLKQR
jgi:hypothetical protein